LTVPYEQKTQQSPARGRNTTAQQIAGIAGLLAGSYLYAELSRKLSATKLAWGNRGGITLPDLIGVRLLPFRLAFTPILVGALAFLH
jgi:hypothetical protein